MALTTQRNPEGPLRNSSLLQYQEVVWWGITAPPDVDPELDDSSWKVRQQERLDLLGFSKLGSARRGWVIMHRNNMRLWPNDMVPGKEIAIPTLSSLAARKII